MIAVDGWGNETLHPEMENRSGEKGDFAGSALFFVEKCVTKGNGIFP
jgi:hypothetical protein